LIRKAIETGSSIIENYHYYQLYRNDRNRNSRLGRKVPAFVRSFRKMVVKWKSTTAIYGRQKAYDLFGREVLYNVLFQIGIFLKAVRVIKIC